MLDAFARGDSGAAWRLLMTFGPGMHRLALRLTDDADQAEDVVQETFIRVLAMADRFRGGSLAAWLRSVTVHVAFNARRSAHRQARREAAFAMEADTARHAGSDPLLRDALRDGIAGLPDGERTVFVLIELEGWTHAEVAAAMNISTEASRQRLLKARQRLRSDLHALRDNHE